MSFKRRFHGTWWRSARRAGSLSKTPCDKSGIERELRAWIRTPMTAICAMMLFMEHWRSVTNLAPAANQYNNPPGRPLGELSAAS